MTNDIASSVDQAYNVFVTTYDYQAGWRYIRENIHSVYITVKINIIHS